jgi:hypothetical protein
MQDITHHSANLQARPPALHHQEALQTTPPAPPSARGPADQTQRLQPFITRVSQPGGEGTHDTCSCPTRAQPPPRPTSLPFSANRGKLEQYLRNLYAASAFNVREHQPLPMMSGPPLSLNIDPNAIPKPCPGTGPPRHPRHLVTPHGDLHQEKQVAQKNH